MLIEIDVNSTTAASEQLYNQLKYGIINEKLRPNEQLPTVRQLSYDLELAPNTIAKTYYRLQEDAFLELKGRKGTFVSERWKNFQKSSDLNALYHQIDIVLAESKERKIELEQLFQLIRERSMNN